MRVQPAIFAEIFPPLNAYQRAKTKTTKAKERHAPRKTADWFACTRSTARGSANVSAMLLRAPTEARTAITPPPMSQPTTYLRDTRSCSNRSLPAQASRASASVPTKKIVEGARKYFLAGNIAY